MTPTEIADLRIDPSTPGFFLRPDYYDVLARLRAEAPVFEYAPGIKAVTRYHDIREISRDPERFCSGRGVLVNDPLREGGRARRLDPAHGPAAARRVAPDPQPRVHRPGAGSHGGRHPRAGGRAARRACPGGEVVDLVDVLAAPLPVLVICELLGVPESQRSDFRRWSDAAILASDGRAGTQPDRYRVGDGDDRRSSTSWPRTRRRNPADDIVSMLVAAEVEGRTLTAGELVTFNMSLRRRRQRDHSSPDQRLADRAGGSPGPPRRALRRSRRRSPARSRSACAGSRRSSSSPAPSPPTPSSAACPSPRATTW